MWETEIKARLAAIKDKAALRSLQTTDGAAGNHVELGGKQLLNLASNNYLALAGDKRLTATQAAAAERYGTGAAASRLVTGNHPLYEAAEKTLIKWKKCEAALIMGSGYTANLGLLTALAGRHDVIFSDRLNHASIVDGIIASRAEHKRYRHLDTAHLEQQLRRTPADKRKIIITDSVFSMDGDTARLTELVEMKKRYNALLIVDEAHAAGVYGPAGRGLVYEYGLEDDVDIQMGTFSKALGSAGAYITGKSWMIEYLLNTMRSLIYTTALPPAVLAASIEAMQIAEAEPDRRSRLHENSALFRKALETAGFHTYGSTTQIVPIRVGDNETALAFSRALQDAGIAAVAIRPPTVPEQEARIRFAIHAGLEKDQLIWAAGEIVRIGKRYLIHKG